MVNFASRCSCVATNAQKFTVDDNIFIECLDRIVPGMSILPRLKNVTACRWERTL